MIIGKGEFGRYLLATPTKCGTTTVESIANRYKRQHPDGKGFLLYDGETPRRQHRMVPPVGKPKWADAEHTDVYLLVRNPYGRYTSIFEYLRAPANYSQWGAKIVQGSEWGGSGNNEHADRAPMDFPQFLAWYQHARALDAEGELKDRPDVRTPAAYRSPWVWLDSQSDSYNMLQYNMSTEKTIAAIGLIRLEQLWTDLAAVLGTYGIRDVDLTPLHSNRSTTRHYTGETVVAEKEDALSAWSRYYNSGDGLCGPALFSGRSRKDWACANTAKWGGLCPACALGIAQEARELGYLLYPKQVRDSKVAPYQV